MTITTETRSNLDQLADLIREALVAQVAASFAAGRYSAGAGTDEDYAAVDAKADTAAAKAVELWTAFYAHGGDHGAALIELDALRQAADQHSALLERIDQVLPARAL